MKKILLILSALTVCISVCACGSSSSSFDSLYDSTNFIEKENEEAYDQLVEYATEGKYSEGCRVVETCLTVLEYKDAGAYYDYCVAMCAYEAGGIGEAYKALKNVSDILNAETTISKIEERIGKYNGYYVCDNGKGAYLHIVIKDGFVALGVTGYNDEDNSFVYDESDFLNSLVISKHSDGNEYLAVGLYGSANATVTVHYDIYTFEDSHDLMLVAPTDSNFDTMNGLYNKCAQPSK